MRFGLALPVTGALASADAIRRTAEHAEDLGYDNIWTADHILIPEKVVSKYPYTSSGSFRLRWSSRFYDPIGTLGFLAGVTNRVQLGVSVLVLPYRNAVATAKALATIDDLSGGRLILGVGVGWMAEEFAALGLPERHFHQRGRLTDETIRVFRALWADGLSSFQGDFYTFTAAGAYPKPAQADGIPIWIGGNSAPALRRAAALGDGWHAITLTLEAFRAKLIQLRRLTQAAGRDPDALAISVRTGIYQVPTGAAASQPPVEPGQMLVGDASSLASQIIAFRDAGAHEMLVTLRAGETLDDLLRKMEEFCRVMELVRS